VYWLQLKNGFFYVGQTTMGGLVERIQTHNDGMFSAAAWTKIHKPQPYALVRWTVVPQGVAGFAEDVKTKELMAAFGIDKVRGGAHCELRLNPAAISWITAEINHNKGVCHKCGKKGHYISSCQATHTPQIKHEIAAEKPTLKFAAVAVLILVFAVYVCLIM